MKFHVSDALNEARNSLVTGREATYRLTAALSLAVTVANNEGQPLKEVGQQAAADVCGVSTMRETPSQFQESWRIAKALSKTRLLKDAVEAALEDAISMIISEIRRVGGLEGIKTELGIGAKKGAGAQKSPVERFIGFIQRDPDSVSPEDIQAVLSALALIIARQGAEDAPQFLAARVEAYCAAWQAAEKAEQDKGLLSVPTATKDMVAEVLKAVA